MWRIFGVDFHECQEDANVVINNSTPQQQRQRWSQQQQWSTYQGGKYTCDLPYPIRTCKTLAVVQEEKKDDEVKEAEPQAQEMMQDFHDTNLLPFPHKNQKAKMDERFGKFIEVIQKLYINIPLIDAIQVPT